MKTAITEQSGVHKAWIPEAKKQTLETLPEFLRHLLQDYQHDYGTIVHALAAGGIAAIRAMDVSPQGGITGFQAGCLGWEMIREYMGVLGPARLLDYENLLYPQYDHKFEKTITSETWDELRKKARENLTEQTYGSPAVRERWQSIADGVLPNGFKLEDKP